MIFESHYKNDPNKCIHCVSEYCIDYNDDYTYCTKCYESNGKTYQTDSNGHYNGFCTTCLSNCDECDSSEICNDCLDNYGFEKNSKGMRTGKCGRCPDHCKDCYYDSSKCSLCKTGYGKTKDAKCQQCPSNCDVCDHDLTKCMKCSSGYILQTKDGEMTGTCAKCVDNCQHCTSTTKCSKCDDGYKLSNGKCI